MALGDFCWINYVTHTQKIDIIQIMLKFFKKKSKAWCLKVS